jgi:hypothetical protein
MQVNSHPSRPVGSRESALIDSNCACDFRQLVVAVQKAI